MTIVGVPQRLGRPVSRASARGKLPVRAITTCLRRPPPASGTPGRHALSAPDESRRDTARRPVQVQAWGRLGRPAGHRSRTSPPPKSAVRCRNCASGVTDATYPPGTSPTTSWSTASWTRCRRSTATWSTPPPAGDPPVEGDQRVGRGRHRRVSRPRSFMGVRQLADGPFVVAVTGTRASIIIIAAAQRHFSHIVTTRGIAHLAQARGYASLNSCRCRPSPSISSSTTSPARRNGFGSGAPRATPAGVPVLITSPG